MKATCLLAVAATAMLFAATGFSITPQHLRALIYRTDPCLAHIIDHEDGAWRPTRSFDGYGDIYASYGLGQADPGTKLASFDYTVDGEHAGESPGPDWATNVWTQLLWFHNYADGRYGSTCNAWAVWQTQRSW